MSVILPVHNGANYLRESIDSVLAQTYRDIELVVLDDGSTDDSAAIARSYEAADPRVRYSKNPGRYGLYKTLNRGFEEAAAGWVRMWAHDDRMTPDCLAGFADFAARHPEAGMVYCDFKEMDEGGRPTGGEAAHRPQRDRTPEVADPDTSALLLLTFGCLPGNISTCMLRKDAWAAAGRFVEGIQQAPDYEMWARMSERFPIGYIDRGLVELRAHPLQLGRQGHKQMTLIEEEKLVYDRLRARLVGRAMTDAEFRRFWRTYKGRGHAHAVARAVARGDFGLARRGLRALRGYGGVAAQFADWLLTANGRVGGGDRPGFYDRMARRLKAEARDVH